MKKLSNERLEEMVIERNEKGLTATVEVMNREELAAYKNNCLEAIERLEIRKAKQKKIGGVMQATQNEIIEELRGFIAYIDSVLAEKEETNVIDAFLADWREKAFNTYSEIAKEFEEIRGDYNKRIQFMREVTKVTCGIITHPAFERNLNDHLDFEVKKKGLLIKGRIKKKVGNVINAKGLHIGDNGEINGTIIGDQGTATIRTIYAGGHSVQSLHFRVLVK